MKHWIAGASALLLAGFVLPAPASAQQASATAQQAHPAWMVGDWSAADDCASIFGLLADGKVKTSDGGTTWRVEGDKLIFVIAGETIARQFSKVSDDKFQIVNGPLFVRCGTAPAPKP